MESNYKHLLYDVITHLGELQRRLAEIDKLESEAKDKAKDKTVSYSLDSLRMLHALEPCIEDARKFYPQFSEFLDSCISALRRIKSELKVE